MDLFASDAVIKSQYVRDTIIASAMSFAMLVLQQLTLKHAVGINDFQVLGRLLFSVLLLQFVAKWWTKDQQKTTTQGFIMANLGLSSSMLTRLFWNGARILVQCWIRADALHHFGFLFAFLLENIDILLLQPMKDALMTSNYQQSGKMQEPHQAWILLLLGYVLVAGVDAYEYGSLVHTFLIIGLALAMQEAQHRTTESKMLLTTSPHFHLLSLICSWILTLPLAWWGSWRSSEDEQDAFNMRWKGEQEMSTVWWTACLFGAAACQLTSLYFARNNVSLAASKSRWMALMTCSVTGLISSLVISAAQDDWLRCGADFLASLVIVYAQFMQWRKAISEEHMTGEAELDTYRSSTHPHSTSSITNGTSVGQILSVLWKKDDSRKILLFLSVNVSYMFVELIVGMWTNSLGLIGDAGHMLFDNSALIIGLVASYVGKLPADAQYTYGYGRVEVLSGFLNSILLVFISFHLLAEASSRFFDPPEVSTDNLLLTSVIGLAVNIVGLVWFHDQVHSGHGHSHGDGCGGGHGHSHSHSHSHSHDHSHFRHDQQSHGESELREEHATNAASNSNMYGVYLHVLADTLGSVGVIISSLLIEYKGWHVADPLSSAMIALLIFASTISLLKETLLQLLQRVPKGMEQDIARALQEVRTLVPGVLEVEQWHIWRHTNDVCVGTLHLLVTESAHEQEVMLKTREIFQQRTQLGKFLTIQVVKNEHHHHPAHVHHHQAHAYHVDGHHKLDNHHDHYHVMTTHENPAGDDVLFANQHKHQHVELMAQNDNAEFTHWKKDHNHQPHQDMRSREEEPNGDLDSSLLPDESDALQKVRNILLDTRCSQGLDPVRLPPKLRDRVEKAQRRAAAAKDGVSIFTSGTERKDGSSTSSNGMAANEVAVPGMEKTKASEPSGALMGRQKKHNSAIPLISMLANNDKIHLPDVVLSHKMRDFEAKTHSNSMLLDPLDNAMNRLTIEEKERVMLKIHEKIQQIIQEIDANFMRVKNELDANGIFDSAANYQRAQALCLVELQKRCKLEKLRDEAIEEILALDTGFGIDNDDRAGRPPGKLSAFLTQSKNIANTRSCEENDDGADAEQRTNQKVTRSLGNSTIAGNLQQRKWRQKAALPRVLSSLEKKTSNQQQHEDEHQQNVVSVFTKKPLSRLEDRKTKSEANRSNSNSKDDSGLNGSREEMLAHHPHILQVLQILSSSNYCSLPSSSPAISETVESNGAAPSKSYNVTVGTNQSNSNSNKNINSITDTDCEERRPISAAEEWAERSKSYQFVAARLVEELRIAGQRRRWDSTGYFTAQSRTGSVPVNKCISEALLNKIQTSQNLRFDIEAEEMLHTCDDVESITQKKNRMEQEYRMVQEQIRTRLNVDNKLTRTIKSDSRAKVGGILTSGRKVGPATFIKKETVAQVMDEESVIPITERSEQKHNSVTLKPSLSTPSLVSSSFDNITQRTGRLGASSSIPNLMRSSLHSRSKQSEQQLTIKRKLFQSQDRSRRAFRKGQLIGAPAPTDLSTIGHHSNARMEQRRYSSQTWTWYQGDDGQSSMAHDLDEYGNHVKRFDDTIQEHEELDEEDDDTIANGMEDDGADEDEGEGTDRLETMSVLSSLSFRSIESARSFAANMHDNFKKSRAIKNKHKRNEHMLRQFEHSGTNLHQFSNSGQSANALVLQTRLEAIWQVLEFPFSNKLAMLEKYAQLRNANAFQTALQYWERAAEIVMIRERMQQALHDFVEHQRVHIESRLTPNDYMILSAHEIEAPADATGTSEAYIDWIHMQMDIVTTKCQELAQELKAKTGDDLQFQGHLYPRIQKTKDCQASPALIHSSLS